MADTLKASIATLIGKKRADLSPEKSPNPIRAWQVLLAERGYSLTRHVASARLPERHVVLYSAQDGTLQAVLSDSPAARGVAPVSRLTVTKASKTADEPKDS